MPLPSALSKMELWLRYWLLSDNYRSIKAVAVTCGVIYGVFCAVLFPAGCLGWDLGLN